MTKLKPLSQIVSLSILFLTILLVYRNVFKLEFQLYWDDYWVVINSYTDKGLTKANLVSILTDFYHSQYAPINEYYYVLINTIFGYNALYFHFFGFLVHTLNVFLTYYFTKSLSLTAFNQTSKSSNNIALLTSLIFGVHTLNLEAVCWIAASKILLYAFFYLSALNLYIKYLISQNKRYFLLLAIFYIISFGCKEQAVTFPVCLILVDYVYGRGLNKYSVWIEKVPMLVLSLFFGYITITSQGDAPKELLDNYSIFERLILCFYSLSEYITKCIIPIKLFYVYPFPFRPGESIPWWLFIYPVTILIGTLTVRKFILKQKWLLYALLFFLIHISIALHLVSLARYSVIADRYAYLSTISFGFAISYYLINTKSRLIKNIRVQNTIFLYIISLAIYTQYRLPIWQNSQTLKRDVSDIIRSRKDYQKLKEKYAD